MTRVALIAVLMAVLMVSAEALTCKSFRHKRVVKVSNSRQLEKAVRNARAGTCIYMNPGRYSPTVRSGGYKKIVFRNKKGNKWNPISLVGPRSAVMDGGSPGGPQLLEIFSSAYLNIGGFTLRNGLKGIEVESSHHVNIVGTRIYNTAMEAIHFSKGSNYNTIVKNHITNTGRHRPGYGEGVYIGSDDSKGKDYMTNNHVIDNTIGPGVTADMIDLKQYTKGGVIKGNKLDGRNLCGCNSANSLINVKGNNYRIVANVGKNSKEDMFRVNTTNRGQGRDNYFSGNKCLGGLRRGYKCVRVPDFGGGNTKPNRVRCGQRSNTRCVG